MKRRGFLKLLTAGTAGVAVASTVPSLLIKAKPIPYTLTDEYSMYRKHLPALAEWHKIWHDKLIRQALLEQHSIGLIPK